MSRALIPAALGALLALTPGLARAQNEAYAIDSSDTLSLVDLDTGSRTDLTGLPGIGLAEALAISDDKSTLYLTNTGGELFTIDVATLSITGSFNTGLGNIEGLDYRNGRLMAVSFSSSPALYDIDPVAGTVTPVGSLGITVPTNPRCFAMESDSVGYIVDYDIFYRIDLNTGAGTAVGPHGSPDNIFGMDFFGDTLIGIGSTAGTVVKFNTATGASVPTGAVLPGAFYLGLAAIPQTSVLNITGELTNIDYLVDRPRDTDFVPGPCGTVVAPDSYNDSQPFDLYQLSPINPAVDVTIEMRSLEPTLADFDPFLALYCNFDRGTPLKNVIALDDDSGFDGDDLTRQNAMINITARPGEPLMLVATSYASWRPARLGMYELIVTNATVTELNPCPPDINRDRVLDLGDVQAFAALFLAGGPEADFNGDGVLDNGDIFAYVSAFLAGC